MASSALNPPSPQPPKPDAVVVTVVGEQDVSRGEWLSAELDAAIETGRPVIVDLSDTELIDSLSIAAILRAAERVHGDEPPLTICAPLGGLPRQVLSLLSVSTRAHVVDTLEAAG